MVVVYGVVGPNVGSTEWEELGALGWMRYFMDVEVAVGGQVGLQLAGQVMLVERCVLAFDAAR